MMEETAYFRSEEWLVKLLKETLFDECGQQRATQEEIDAASARTVAALARAGHRVPPIPADYAAFLRLSNGYAWNGVRFFGTRPVQMGRSYVNPALLEENLGFHERKLGLEDCLVLGGCDDDLFLYSARTGRYAAVDSLTLIPIDDEGFGIFEELFLYAYHNVSGEDGFIENDAED